MNITPTQTQLPPALLEFALALARLMAATEFAKRYPEVTLKN
jgi:hypothetical protein